jgi:hypothetical protein
VSFRPRVHQAFEDINPLNAELNPISHLLTLLGAHHIFHVSGLRVKETWCECNFITTSRLLTNLHASYSNRWMREFVWFRQMAS